MAEASLTSPTLIGMPDDPDLAAPAAASALGFSSRAIHAGQEPDPSTGAVVPPIYQVSTYKQDGIGGLRRSEGTRLNSSH